MNLKVMSRRIKKLNRNENTTKWKGIQFDLFVFICIVSEPNLVYFHTLTFCSFNKPIYPFKYEICMKY